MFFHIFHELFLSCFQCSDPIHTRSFCDCCGRVYCLDKSVSKKQQQQQQHQDLCSYCFTICTKTYNNGANGGNPRLVQCHYTNGCSCVPRTFQK